ncbi:MAG: DUF262 domain-containing protein [Chloroflexota bacterium]|nr:DUF262 domain-containing protein [Chloroflexota bacterium]
MSSIPDYAEIKIWLVKDLMDAASKEPVKNWQITIPEFQRRLVWPENKQKELITSIKKGFPFGSLLLFEDIEKGKKDASNKKYYNLIDGLQRTHALKRYTSNPNSFFSDTDLDEIDNEIGEFVARELGQESEQGRNNVRREIVNWVKSVEGFNATKGWETSGLIQKLISEILKLQPGTEKYFTTTGRLQYNGLFINRLKIFLEAVQQQADINDVKIPIIIFNGPASDLPTVFEKLNAQGTTLSKYEVFAAQWMGYRNHIKNKKIIDAIWKKYEALVDESFTSDAWEDAPDDKSKREREYSLFEYLFGFGQHLSDIYPYLFEKIDPDKPSSIGFNLVSACTGLAIKDMDKLPKHTEKLEQSLLEKCILEATAFVDDTLKSILSVRQHGLKKISIYHTEYQIISMIATAFKIRYERENLADIDGWKTNRSKLENHIVMYYLYDVLRGYWKGSGDSTLQDTVSNLRYLNAPPSKATWENILGAWFADEQIPLVHKGRYVRDQTPEILLLKYIYVHMLTVFKNAKRYHVEHIIPVGKLKTLLRKDDNDDKMAINVISNLSLLESKVNTIKGDLTFVEFLEKQRDDEKITKQEFESKRQDFEDQLICGVDVLPKELTRSSYDDFVTARFDVLKAEFLRVWRDYIPPDPQT